MIHVEVFMEYVTYLLMAIGILAFLVAAVVQVIKELPTSAVALAVSLGLCLLAVMIGCQCFGISVTWYYVFAAFMGAFVVYLVATGGWERIAEIWQRTGYNQK